MSEEVKNGLERSRLFKEVREHEYKMYSVVLRKLKDLDNGIQTAHGISKYISNHWEDEDLQQWLKYDNTIVVLNGGDTPEMSEIIETFEKEGVKYEIFQEPALGYLTTSIVVLADERVWDRKIYPTYIDWVSEQVSDFNDIVKEEYFEKYNEFVGGKTNAVKKEILNDLRTI